MVQFAAVSALTFAALLGGMIAWLLSTRRLRQARQRARYGFDAQAAVWRHPAGRGRWPEMDGRRSPRPADPPLARPVGPDDDPEFISALERLIRGERGEPS